MLIESIVEQCRRRSIPVITTNKGELNNLTQDKPHQAREKEKYDYHWMFLNHKNRAWYLKHPQGQPLSSRIQRIFDQVSGLHWIKFKILRYGTNEATYASYSLFQKNLGSILRTAHFFGVDGVLLCNKNRQVAWYTVRVDDNGLLSAPLTPSVSKVSSGAMEVMDIYSTRSLVNFLKVRIQVSLCVYLTELLGLGLYNRPWMAYNGCHCTRTICYRHCEYPTQFIKRYTTYARTWKRRSRIKDKCQIGMQAKSHHIQYIIASWFQGTR